MAINPEPRVTTGRLNANTDKAHVAPCAKVIYRLFVLLMHSASTTASLGPGYCGKGYRKKALCAAGAIGLSLMAANYVRASEGAIDIDYGISSLGGSSYTLAHIEGASEGFDDQDGVYYSLFGPNFAITKAITYLDGNEVNMDIRPLNSTSSATVYLGLVSKSGDPIELSNATQHIELTVRGFDGYDVYVDGEDARTTNRIDFGDLNGTYDSGETIRTIGLTFSQQTPVIESPILDTTSARNITNTSADLRGKILDDGGEECEYRFLYWKLGDEANADYTDWNCCADSGDSFSANVSGLETGGLYYFQGEASNSAGVSSGDLESFVASEDVEPGPDEPWLPANNAENPISGQFTRDTLFIRNTVGGFSDAETGAWALTFVPGASTWLDEDDVPYVFPSHLSKTSRVTSRISETRGGRASRHVIVDAIPVGLETDIRIELGLEGRSGEVVQFDTPAENKLVFSFPKGSKDNFGNTPLTFWRVDLSEPDEEYPVWDVRRVISAKEGQVRLADLTGTYDSRIPYAYAVVSTDRKPGDIERDGKIDAADYAAVLAAQGFEGHTRADVAGPGGLGLPDGVVDNLDLYYLYIAMDPAEAAGISPVPHLPSLFEDFETGTFDRLNWSRSGDSTWTLVSSESHSGQYCACSGAIGDWETTTLSLNLDCRTGQIRFWRKVSSEAQWDVLRFDIDGVMQGEWSGERDWEEVSFPVEGGARTLTWTYTKDGSMSNGDDTAWIDDVLLPATAAE